MTEEKPLRADARRNRARVLEAAEQVFTKQGTGASTEEVARTAGVGVGTVFRHFPTKEALLQAVLLERLRRLAEEADALAEAHPDDPGTAFFSFFTLVIDQSETKMAFADALAAAGVDVQSAASPIGQSILAAISRLLHRAQQASEVRPDVAVPELKALLIGATRALEAVGPDPALRARVLAVLLDGLRG